MIRDYIPITVFMVVLSAFVCCIGYLSWAEGKQNEECKKICSPYTVLQCNPTTGLKVGVESVWCLTETANTSTRKK
jgi:hypothetical protein